MSFGLRLNKGDIALSSGKLSKVSGTEKLSQDILKIVLTEVNANKLHPWYGSYLTQNVIGEVLDIGVNETIIKSQIQSSIETLKNLQEEQSKFQTVSADEQIASISDVSVRRSPVDPRLYEVFIKVFTKSFKVVSSSFQITK